MAASAATQPESRPEDTARFSKHATAPYLIQVDDRLTLRDGTEVVVIGVDDHIRPQSWEQTVHVGDVW